MGQAVGVMRNASSAAWAMSFGWIIISALPRDLREPHTVQAVDRVSSLSCRAQCGAWMKASKPGEREHSMDSARRHVCRDQFRADGHWY